MTTLLVIHSSLKGAAGASGRLASDYAAAFRARHPDGRVLERDLAADPIPHLDAETFAAFGTPAAQRTPAQAAAVARSDALIAELRDADEIVIAAPMYNFGIPSTLKAWIDHVARAGVTFRYTANGPEGLLTGKRAIVVATRGGAYAGTPGDTQSPYLAQILAFLGIRDVSFVYAEGLAMGAERADAATRGARESITVLAGRDRAAAHLAHAA